MSSPDASSDRNQVTLHGERLLLRRAQETDRAALAAILCEPEVVRWWGPYDPETALDELDISFVIVVDDTVAGWLLFEEETWWQYPKVSFDIALTTRLQGMGYGQETLRVAIEHFARGATTASRSTPRSTTSARSAHMRPSGFAPSASCASASAATVPGTTACSWTCSPTSSPAAERAYLTCGP